VSKYFSGRKAPAPRWHNWGRTVSCAPSRTELPSDALQISRIVTGAAESGATVKPVGAGHSFTSIAATDDIRLDLRNMRGLSGVDTTRKQVTLYAGTHLHEIPGLLAPHGLAMANLGDIDRQTISGAISTGTHGTGLGFGGIATQIVGAKLVTGTGEIRTVSAGDDDLRAVALGLGALGVLAEVTVQCVDAFCLRAEERPRTADEAFGTFLDEVAAQDHYEFYWFPHTSQTLTKTNTRLPAGTDPDGPGKVRRYVDDELLSNKMFRALCEVGVKAPRLVKPINQLTSRALSARTFTDVSTGVFTSSRNVRFGESEFAIPLEAVPEALRDLRNMIDRKGFRVSFPIEVRAAGADDLLLSTASGRDSGYIAVHRYHRDDPADSAAYFAGFEAIMVGYGGRPHWGKLHTRDASYFREAYPGFEEFLAVRDRYDPDRVFANPYLKKVLG